MDQLWEFEVGGNEVNYTCVVNLDTPDIFVFVAYGYVGHYFVIKMSIYGHSFMWQSYLEGISYADGDKIW